MRAELHHRPVAEWPQESCNRSGPPKGSFNKLKCSVCGEYVFVRYVRIKDGIRSASRAPAIDRDGSGNHQCCRALPEADILRVAPDAPPSLNQLARRPNPIPRWPIIPTF